MNCSFNIRYKPRTTRSFTKSDLTVYDSAGNTALNALTVYGKSEVVDGAIKSAGEGWSTVDLGTLTWAYNTSGSPTPHFDTQFPKPTGVTNYTTVLPMMCTQYDTSHSWSSVMGSANMYGYLMAAPNNYLAITDSNYTTAEAFKSAMSGVLLCYKIADPTQGNAIAVKTDDSSGINGTMAAFTTGTPLRGIPDTTVRDVMAWDGSSGEVIKNCAKVRLADLMWEYRTSDTLTYFYTSTASFPSGNIKYNGDYSTTLYNLICSAYPVVKRNATEFINKTLTVDGTTTQVLQIQIKDTDYTTVSDFIASLGDAELVYELATPTTEQLTTAENASIAGLRTFEPQTHAQNNAGTDMTVDYTIRVPTI